MNTRKFSEVENEIIKHLRERRLIPILGSGFTVGSQSYNGSVPSGSDMKKYMSGKITEKYLI